MTDRQITIDVYDCPRCGDSHRQIGFQSFRNYRDSIIKRPTSMNHARPDLWFIGVCQKSMLILRAHVTIETVGVLNAEQACAENTLEIEERFGQWTKEQVEIDPSATARDAPNSPLESAIFLATRS